MLRLLVLLVLCGAAHAQTPQAPAQKPTPEELAFARLPADLQQRLSYLTPAQAMQAIAQTGQHAIALGNPNPSVSQFRSTLDAVLAPGSGYVAGSAGSTSFPPLSPLVAPPPPAFLTR
jgi:hypothetical protein